MSQSAPGPTQGLTALESLAPQYDETQHRIYVDLLRGALKDPRNRNIALSGPYGTGKSSVLNKFQDADEYKHSTLRLAISTLAPDAAGATLSNRIQKEVLKQLVYSAQPRTLRHSRFTRRGPLSWWRAVGESVGAVGVLGALLTLLGRLPSQVASGPEYSAGQRVAVWAGLAVLLVIALAVLRVVTYSRFVISDVAAAGATLTLSEANNTYFDEYLDEILYFFEQESKNIVIFEDLDRYNDPQIFEALRELNTLLNNTPKRRKKIDKDQEPLRFIYAMRDSLFERIGENDAEPADGDAARAETVRANRTKFFEVVIPVVPFISHRTARDHLRLRLGTAEITDIDTPLVELVAKHATDMRLLQNMCNEYRVFAERLLKPGTMAPGLSPSRLFALVAYKNFHLQDFEHIARRSSDLDRLYDYHRELVATSVADREHRTRDLLSKSARPVSTGSMAEKLGRRLQAIAILQRDHNQGWSDRELRFTVGSENYTGGQTETLEFWDAVVQNRSIALSAFSQYTSPQPLATIQLQSLKALFSEVLPSGWERLDAQAVQKELQTLSREIEDLRGADFRDLVARDDFLLTVPARTTDSGSADAGDFPFGVLVTRTLKSDLSRDLVRHGYIDRNFTLYAAQFYGDFAGADVATFIVQTVQTNRMDIDYRFTGDVALKNLMVEAGEDFTQTVSAYNIQVVDYLLVSDVERAGQVVDHLTSSVGSDQKRFLAAFLTSGSHRTELAAHLSGKPWAGVFSYLVSDPDVPADVRTALVSAALVAADPKGEYDLGSEVADFFLARYLKMPAFTEQHPQAQREAIVAVLKRAEVLLPSPGGVHEELKALIVENDLYELTGDSLRAAVNLTGEVSLDRLRDNAAVYDYCLANLEAYLDALVLDRDLHCSVRTPETLLAALRAALEHGLSPRRVTQTASPNISLSRLTEAPTSAWPALAEAQLFKASLANLEDYRAKIGEIDKHLGGLLASADAILTAPAGAAGEAESEPSVKIDAAVAVLNAGRSIPSPEARVRLVHSLSLAEPLQATHVTQVTPEESNLFALLIEQGSVPDDASTFAHLHEGGWAAVEPAIKASTKFEEFLTPGLVTGMVADLFATPDVSRRIKELVLDSLAEYVPTVDAESLAAAAKFAIDGGRPLPVEQIQWVASTCRDATLTVVLLALAEAPASHEVVEVLSELGGEFANLASGQHDEFEVPDDESHRAVFKILEEANLCRFSKKPRKPLLIIKRP